MSQQKDRNNKRAKTEGKPILIWTTNGGAFSRVYVGIIARRKRRMDGKMQYWVETVRSVGMVSVVEGEEGVLSAQAITLFHLFLFFDYAFDFFMRLGDEIPELGNRFDNGYEEYLANLNLERGFRQSENNDPPPSGPESAPEP